MSYGTVFSMLFALSGGLVAAYVAFRHARNQHLSRQQNYDRGAGPSSYNVHRNESEPFVNGGSDPRFSQRKKRQICKLCNSEVTENKMFRLDCGHEFHGICLLAHIIAVKLLEGQHIVCPQDNCEQLVTQRNEQELEIMAHLVKQICKLCNSEVTEKKIHLDCGHEFHGICLMAHIIAVKELEGQCIVCPQDNCEQLVTQSNEQELEKIAQR